MAEIINLPTRLPLPEPHYTRVSRAEMERMMRRADGVKDRHMLDWLRGLQCR